MKHGLLFSLVTISLFAIAFLRGNTYWLLIYPAISFALVTFAYLGAGSCVFGKRSDGQMSFVLLILLAPYLLVSWLIWHTVRLFSSEPKLNQVTDDLILSRRLLNRELPREVASVVDLTCEFIEPIRLRHSENYISFPMLDASVRTAEELRELAITIESLPNPVLIHCAQGHGRTGLVAAAFLVVSKYVATPSDAIALIRSVRPGVKLNHEQLQTLKKVAA